MSDLRAVMVEVRAAEGGEHSKELVEKQAGVYLKVCARRALTVEIVDRRPGMLVLRVSGAGAAATFADEGGGHRWQETRSSHGSDKVQTSTVTIAILDEPAETEFRIAERDLDWTACRGSGAGGQARNKTNSAVQLTHLPTGTMVRCEGERSQWQNRQTAMSLLRARLWGQQRAAEQSAVTENRRRQLGCGARADKRRTIACQRGTVVDHVTGRKWELSRYLKGEW